MTQLLRIRLYNDVMWCECTEEQWQRFLSSQDRALARNKKGLTLSPSTAVHSVLGSNGTNVVAVQKAG